MEIGRTKNGNYDILHKKYQDLGEKDLNSLRWLVQSRKNVRVPQTRNIHTWLVGTEIFQIFPGFPESQTMTFSTSQLRLTIRHRISHQFATMKWFYHLDSTTEAVSETLIFLNEPALTIFEVVIEKS